MAKKKVPNEETQKAMEETDLVSFDTVEELLTDLAAPEQEVVEKVVTEETGKTFDFKADVFYFDDINLKTRKVNYSNCEVIFKNPLPVYSGDKVIGSATVELASSLDGKVLEAEFFLDNATPERLDIETKSIPLYPHLDCYCEVIASKGVNIANKMFIKGIMLTLHRTLDDRIKQL